MVAIQVGQQHEIEVGRLEIHRGKLLVDSLAKWNTPLIDVIENPRAKALDLRCFVVDSFGRHVAVPTRIYKYQTLRVLNQIDRNGQPNPVLLRGGHARCFQQVAVVAAKGQIGLNTDFACVQNVYFHHNDSVIYDCETDYLQF